MNEAADLRDELEEIVLGLNCLADDGYWIKLVRLHSGRWVSVAVDKKNGTDHFGDGETVGEAIADLTSVVHESIMDKA